MHEKLTLSRCAPALFVLVSMLAACGGGSSGRDGVAGANQGLVVGRVRTEDGSSLTKMRVRAGRKSAQTDAKGNFEIEVEPGDEQRVYVDSKDFAGGEVVLKLGKGSTARVELGVMRVRSFAVEDAEKGGRFEDDEGFVIDLPEKALQSPAGDIAKGKAEIRYATVRDPRLMRVPPELRGVSKAGRQVRLASKGLVEVRFYQDDEPLKFDGQATVEVPLPTDSGKRPGQRVGLYHYNVEEKRFEEEGEAEVSDDGKWVATVEKFSWWTAADVVDATSCVSGELLTPEEMPAEGSVITAVGLTDLWLSSATTAADGTFCVEAPAESQVQLSAFWDEGGSAAEWATEATLPEGAGSCGGEDCEELGAQIFNPIATTSDSDAGDEDPSGDAGDEDSSSDAGVDSGSDGGDQESQQFERITTTEVAEAAGDVIRVPFGALGLERLAYTIVSTADVTADARVLGPTGNRVDGGNLTISAGNSAYRDTFQLPEVPGEYVLEIVPRNEGTGSFDLDLFSVPDDLELPVVPGGEPVSLTIESIGQNAALTFEAEGEERLAYTIESTADQVIDVSVVGPTGSRVSGGNVTVSAGNSAFRDLFELPEVPGTYRIEIDPRNQGRGGVVFSLLSVPGDVVIDGAIDAEEPAVFELDSVGQNGVLRFEAQGGERVAYTVSSTIATTIDVSLLNPNGLNAGGAGGVTVSATSNAFEDLFELSEVPGVYELRINPRNQGTGTITLSLFSVPADATTEPVTLSDYASAPQITLTTATPGQNAFIDLVVPQGGESVAYLITNSIGTPVDASLREDPDVTNDAVPNSGRTISSNASGFREPFDVQAPGTYRFFMSPRAQGVGTLTAQIFRVPAPATATVDGTAVATVSTPGQVAHFFVSLSADETVSLQLSRRDSSVADVRVLDSAGNAVSFSGGSTLSGNTLDLTITAPATDGYTIEVDPRGDAVDSYSVLSGFDQAQ